MATFGKRMRSLRNERELTLDSLASDLNTTKATLSRYENDNRIPNIDFINSLSDYFNVSSDYLLGKSDIKNPYTENSLPEGFETPQEAMKFLLEDSVIMGFGGFDIDKLTDDEKVQFANELLEQLKLVSYKYKK